MFQPGHTAGHLVLQLAGVLYTGDHLAVTRQVQGPKP
jgi:glyoxylase-like metal-dependent hydrolase (beta-lactamase superfamily II)